MSIGLGQHYRQRPLSPERLGLLGSIILQAVAFARVGFDAETRYEDPVHNETVAAGVAFTRDEKTHVWLLDPERLPGDPNIKAVAVDANCVFLETAPIDLADLEALLDDERLEAARLNRVRDRRKDEYAIQIGTPAVSIMELMPGKQIPREFGPRWLLTLNWKDRSEEQVLAAAWIVDTVDQRSLYSSSSAAAAPAVAGMSMRQELAVQIQLQLEQQPCLLMSMQANMAVLQQLELRTIMTLQHQVLRASPEVRGEIISRIVEKHGEQAALRVVVFILAGQIKAERPTLSWPKARRAASRLVKGLPT